MDLMKDEGTQRLARGAFWMVIIATILFGLVYFSSLLQPLVIALFIWYIIREITRLLGLIKVRKKILPEWLRISFSFVIIILILSFIGLMLVDSLEQIAERLPEYQKSQDNIIDQIASNRYIVQYTPELIARLKGMDFQPIVAGVLNSLTATLGNVLLIIIYVIFLLIEETVFSRKLRLSYDSQKKYNEFIRIRSQLNNSVNRYLFMKTLISLLTGFLSYWILLFMGVDFPILWAFLIFLFNYIPYIGSLVATLLPAAFAIIQFNSLTMFIWVFLAVEMVQIIVGNYIEPKWMGKSLNQSPLVVVLTLTFWGSIWGLLGMFISVPFTSVLIIILAQFPGTRRMAILMTETGDIESMISRDDQAKTEQMDTDK